MKAGRRIWLVMAVALSSLGCRAAGTGSLSLFPRPASTLGSVDVEEFVAQHNRNAESIRSLEAKPAIEASLPLRPHVHVDGRMALERPRNFRLQLESHRGTEADIGSNNEEFWFWVSNRNDPYIYWCNYRDLESSSLAVTYQPDWIIDALGLKPISAEEEKQIQARKGPEPGTTALVFPETRSRSGSYRRWMIVSNRDRRIKQLRIYSAAEPAVLIAQADPSQYKPFPVRPGETGTTEESCYLPEKLVLEWKGDQRMKLEVLLLEVGVNQFDPARSTVLFNEPKIEGYQRKNLAELNRGARQAGQRTTARRTMPSPSVRNGIELGHPTPLMDDDNPVVPNLEGATARSSSTSTPPPALPPLEALVGSPLPSPPESAGMRAARADQYPPSGFTVER
jgi:hypothetical protein